MLSEEKILNLYNKLKLDLEELYEIRYYSDEDEKYRELPSVEMKELYDKIDILEVILEIL